MTKQAPTSPAAPKTAPTKTNVERVSAEFAAAATLNMRCTLEWVSGWYTKLAEATLKDEVAHTFGKTISKLSVAQKKAFGLFLMKRVMQASRTIDNVSTSLGTNALRAATLAAEADLARQLVGATLTQDEKEAWDCLPEAQNAETAASETA